MTQLVVFEAVLIVYLTPGDSNVGATPNNKRINSHNSRWYPYLSLCLRRSAFSSGSPCQCSIILEIPSAYFPACAANPRVETTSMSFCSRFSTFRTCLFMALRVTMPSSSFLGCHSSRIISSWFCNFRIVLYCGSTILDAWTTDEEICRCLEE